MHENNPQEFSDLIARLQASRDDIPPLPVQTRATIHAYLVAQYPIRRTARFVPISLAVTTIIIISLIVWAAYPRPVSAAEIVSRATIAATNAAAFGLNSYTGTKIVWYTSEPGKLAPNMQERIWAKLPNLLHEDIYAYPQNLANSAGPTLSDPVYKNATFVNDGTTVWLYQVVGNYVEQHLPAAMPLPPIPTDFQSLISKLAQDNTDVTQLGPDVIAGRAAYVLSFKPKSDIVIYPMSVQVKAWIDQQTYFQLGQEYLDKQGNVVYKWEYTDFKPNVDIDPAMFTYTPAPGVQVVDLRPPQDEAELTAAWQGLARTADYKVFRPMNVPATLIAERPHYTNGPTGYLTSFSQLEQDFYAKGQQLPAMLLYEDRDKGNQSMSGDPVRIGNYDGTYYEEAGRRMVQFVRDGTWIFVQVDQQLATKDELFQIARNMELVGQ